MSELNYEKVRGQRYRVLADKATQTWKQLSFKTAAEDVYFSNNESESLSRIQGLTYTKTLPLGETVWSYPIDGLGSDSRIDIYTDKSNVSPTSITVTGSGLEVVFPAQSEDMVVKAVVGAFVDASTTT